MAWEVAGRWKREEWRTQSVIMRDGLRNEGEVRKGGRFRAAEF